MELEIPIFSYNISRISVLKIKTCKLQLLTDFICCILTCIMYEACSIFPAKVKIRRKCCIKFGRKRSVIELHVNIECSLNMCVATDSTLFLLLLFILSKASFINNFAAHIQFDSQEIRNVINSMLHRCRVCTASNNMLWSEFKYSSSSSYV